jgi:hypothetical protein
LIVAVTFPERWGGAVTVPWLGSNCLRGMPFMVVDRIVFP